MKSVFLDTNVLIDYFGSRAGYPEAATIVTLAQRRKIQLCVSSLSFATASYILSAHHKRTHAEIMKMFAQFTTLCHVTTIDGETVDEAIHSDFHDFEDALQHHSAFMAHCDAIVTRNKPDFTTSKLQVYEPREFLSAITGM